MLARNWVSVIVRLIPAFPRQLWSPSQAEGRATAGKKLRRTAGAGYTNVSATGACQNGGRMHPNPPKISEMRVLFGTVLALRICSAPFWYCAFVQHRSGNYITNGPQTTAMHISQSRSVPFSQPHRRNSNRDQHRSRSLSAEAAIEVSAPR